MNHSGHLQSSVRKPPLFHQSEAEQAWRSYNIYFNLVKCFTVSEEYFQTTIFVAASTFCSRGHEALSNEQLH